MATLYFHFQIKYLSPNCGEGEFNLFTPLHSNWRFLFLSTTRVFKRVCFSTIILLYTFYIVAVRLPYFFFIFIFLFLFLFSFFVTVLSGPKATSLPRASVLHQIQVAATNVFDTLQVRMSVCLTASLSVRLSLCRSKTFRCLSIASGCQHLLLLLFAGNIKLAKNLWWEGPSLAGWGGKKHGWLNLKRS